jgi:hypothetical protein
MLNIDNLLTATYGGRKILAKNQQDEFGTYQKADKDTPYKDCLIFEIDRVAYDIMLSHDHNLNECIDYSLTVLTECGKRIEYTWDSGYINNCYNFEDIFILPN